MDINHHMSSSSLFLLSCVYFFFPTSWLTPPAWTKPPLRPLCFTCQWKVQASGRLLSLCFCILLIKHSFHIMFILWIGREAPMPRQLLPYLTSTWTFSYFPNSSFFFDLLVEDWSSFTGQAVLMQTTAWIWSSIVYFARIHTRNGFVNENQNWHTSVSPTRKWDADGDETVWTLNAALSLDSRSLGGKWVWMLEALLTRSYYFHDTFLWHLTSSTFFNAETSKHSNITTFSSIRSSTCTITSSIQTFHTVQNIK